MQAAFLDYDTLGPGDVDPAPLQRLLPGIVLHPGTRRDEIDARLAHADIVMINKVRLDATALGRAPRLKLVCLAATGTDNVDVAAARELGIAVANIRDYCVPSVTQHVFALVLALTQRLREHDALVASGAWSRSDSFCLLDHPFHELAGRTLGIVGLGSLGRGVARVARAFGMEVLAARRPYGATGAQHAAPAEDGVRRVALVELLARSHVVSLHCPLTEETRGVIDATALARMRPDALLVNTARGGLVDPGALLDALRRGTIAGAGIDVLEREPPPADHPLLTARLPNLIVTPHVAWAARESRQRVVEEIALNVAAFLSGARRNRLD
jgi:glycerate dehydrogenase